MNFHGIQVIESPYVEEGSLLIVNYGKEIPPLVLGPGEVATVEQRIAHLLKHGAVIVVKNIGDFKEKAGL